MKSCWFYLASVVMIALVVLPKDVGAQKPKAYYLEEDEVVFVFDIRDYEAVTRENSQERLDFSDIDIYKVAVTGEFNNWSRKGWTMEKVGEYTYHLRKKLSDFGDAFPIQFKYLINDEYWAEPGATFPTVRKFSNEFIEETYNLTLYDVMPSVEGNTFFFLAGHTNAREVILTGTFVGWDEGYLKMERIDGGWLLRLDLLPARYEYKFIVDGEWIHDPENPEMVMNEHGTFNSVLSITRQVEFALPSLPNFERVELVGSFTRWSRIPMDLRDGVWRCDVALPGGKYHYKFVVNGRYVRDPQNPLVERSKDGIEFSVKIVQ